MQLTVLGRCGKYPMALGATSCYLIEEDGCCIVLDMGSGGLSRLLTKVKIEEISAIVLTHLHGDHMCDMLPFKYLALEYYNKTNNKIKVFLPYDIKSLEYKLIDSCVAFEIINITTETYLVKNLQLKFYEMTHTVPTFGVKIIGSKTFAYTSDTTLNSNLKQLVQNASVVLGDACAICGSESPAHLTVYQLAKTVEPNCLLLLTHLIKENLSNALSEAKTIHKNTLLCEENIIYNIT